MVCDVNRRIQQSASILAHVQNESVSPLTQEIFKSIGDFRPAFAAESREADVTYARIFLKNSVAYGRNQDIGADYFDINFLGLIWVNHSKNNGCTLFAFHHFGHVTHCHVSCNRRAIDRNKRVP